MSLYTVYRMKCCIRNRRVCIYNNMYNECLCTPSLGWNVVVVIVGFVFTTTCTMNVCVHGKYKPYEYDYNSPSYRRCTKTFIVHVVVNTIPTITTTTFHPIDGVQCRVCIYNNMYNECLCTPSIGGTVVVVIEGFVLTTTCTMNIFVHRL
jgi:hypothetical protein